jgi:D-aspartate ligase
MPSQRNTSQAVVLGSDFKALGVIRSLGRRGVRSVVIDNTPRSAWFSRYVSQRIKWPGSMDSEAFVRFLLKIAKTYHLEQSVLYPTQDEAVELVAQNTQSLGQVYRLATQHWDVIRWASDKRLTHHMAQEVGIPYPTTWYPANEQDLKATELQFPVIIKPAISVRLQYTLHLKALPAHNWDELLAHYRLAARIIKPAEIMVQEIIPGDGYTQYSVGTYCKNGQIVASMTARRTRQYPIDYGLGSSFVEALEVPDITAYAAKLLQFMNVSGMVEVEFKYDQRNQQYKLLDINVRPWGWHTLCIACGLDFPYIQHCDILGASPVDCTQLTPHYDYHWARLLTDVLAAMQYIREGSITPAAYLSSFWVNTTFSVFDERDPLPVLGDFAMALRRGFNDKFRRKS